MTLITSIKINQRATLQCNPGINCIGTGYLEDEVIENYPVILPGVEMILSKGITRAKACKSHCCEVENVVAIFGLF